MRSQFIIIFCIASQEPAKLCFFDDDAVVDALASNRANQAFGVRILPWGPGRGGFVSDPHGAQSLLHAFAKDAVTVTDKITRRLVAWKRLGNLPCNPFRRRMPGDVAPGNEPSIKANNNESIKEFEAE